MAISDILLTRSESKCELCFAEGELHEYIVPPKASDEPENQVVLCSKCLEEVTGADLDSNHWRCLNESMWSAVPAVQVMAYRLLHRLSAESWAQDLAGSIYLDEEALEWAKSGGSNTAIIHKDSNGHILQSGDSVTLIQELNVKGSTITAKRGTAIRRIRLDPNNAEYIEGKVDGQSIVILTKFVKKST
ncbi:MAG: protein PhnA [Saprospiraceae bacterium]|jgi:protein PhnA